MLLLTSLVHAEQPEPEHVPERNEIFISANTVLDVRAMGMAMPGLEFKLGIPVSENFFLTLPVRVYSMRLSHNFEKWTNFFDISSGLGVRWQWSVVKWRSLDLKHYVEPSIRAGYNDWIVKGVWLSGYLQSGIILITKYGLFFGGGFGISAGGYVWAEEKFLHPDTFKRGAFLGVEGFGTLGYSW